MGSKLNSIIEESLEERNRETADRLFSLPARFSRQEREVFGTKPLDKLVDRIFDEAAELRAALANLEATYLFAESVEAGSGGERLQEMIVKDFSGVVKEAADVAIFGLRFLVRLGVDPYDAILDKWEEVEGRSYRKESYPDEAFGLDNFVSGIDKNYRKLEPNQEANGNRTLFDPFLIAWETDSTYVFLTQNDVSRRIDRCYIPFFFHWSRDPKRAFGFESEEAAQSAINDSTISLWVSGEDRNLEKVSEIEGIRIMTKEEALKLTEAGS